MSINVEFTNVSKRYKLGMTRASLPSIISELVRTSFSRKQALPGKNGFHWALQDVSFNLSKGDSLALIGSNGAGKTTILKLLAQITKPTSGSLNVRGKLSALIELGAGFHPDLSGRENIYLNASILGLKKQEIKQRFDSIVAFSELDRFIDTPVKRYSSGMAVRLGFAVAASIDPDVLLVDEVLAVGDSTFRLKCMRRIQELIDQGTTLIFVSHNMGLIKAVCQNGLFIERGQQKFFGSVNDAIDMYNRSLNEKRIVEAESTREGQELGSGIADILKVDVIDPEENIENVVKSNKAARFVIHYQSFQDIGEASLVLRIMRSDGISCCSMYSRLDEFKINIKQGRGSVTIEMDPSQLYPGTYFGVVTLKNAIESLTYDKVYSDWFEVKGEGSGYEDRDAVYEPNRRWEHQHFGEQIVEEQQAQ